MNSALSVFNTRYGAARRISKRWLVAAMASVAFWSPAWAEPVTIVALGDSLTHGYGLEVNDGFVPQLQNALQAQGLDVAVMNAGVSGDTTAGGLARLDWSLSPESDALIVALGGNDLLRGIDPSASRANLDQILSRATERGLAVMLVGMQAPGNYGPDYKADFDAMYPELATEYDAIYYPSFLGALTAIEDRAAAMAQYMQADGIHPNAEGVAVIVQDMVRSVAELVAKAQTE